MGWKAGRGGLVQMAARGTDDVYIHRRRVMLCQCPHGAGPHTLDSLSMILVTTAAHK
jgi:hypothetical protein